MYYPYFITYIVAGFVISFLAIMWAYRNGQFSDQQRARFLPLEKEPQREHRELSRTGRYELYGLILLVSIGLMVSVVMLLFVIYSGIKIHGFFLL